MLGETISEHIKIINDVIKNHNLSYEERREFVRGLSENDMRIVFLEMCEVWSSNKEKEHNHD